MHPSASHWLLATLQHHIGRDNGITARELVREVNTAAILRHHVGGDLIRERDLRTLVQELRLQGQHVCAHPTSGYYLAASPEELQVTLDFLRDRAVASLKQVAAMQRVSLPDLVGQLHLPT